MADKFHLVALLISGPILWLSLLSLPGLDPVLSSGPILWLSLHSLPGLDPVAPGRRASMSLL